MKSKILTFTVILLSVISAQAKPLPVSVKSHEGTFTLQSPSISVKAEGVAPLSMMLYHLDVGAKGTALGFANWEGDAIWAPHPQEKGVQPVYAGHSVLIVAPGVMELIVTYDIQGNVGMKVAEKYVFNGRRITLAAKSGFSDKSDPAWKRMDAQPEREFGTLEDVPFESCVVPACLDEYRAYFCYGRPAEGDFTNGQKVFGQDAPVSSQNHPDSVIRRIVFAMDNPSNHNKTLFLEFPAEAYTGLTHPALGPIFSAPANCPTMALQGENVTVSMLGGDGVASYKVDWIIDTKRQEVQRLVFDGENECSDVSRALERGQWLKLKEIPAPRTVISKAK